MRNAPTPTTFSARLKLVLGGRKPTPWCENLLIPSGTMSRMFKGDGVPPTYETLAKITRTENVSLSWLLDGIGAMYLIGLVADDANLAGEVRMRLEDEPLGSIAVLTDGDRAAVVFHQPAQLVERRGPIDYQAVEVLAGPIGMEFATAMTSLGGMRGIIVKTLPREEMLQGMRGGWGSYQLLGEDGRGGMLNEVAAGYTLYNGQKSFKVSDVFSADDGFKAAGIRAELMKLTALMPDLQPDERTAIAVLVDAMAERVRARKIEGR